MKRLNGMDAMLLYSETPNLHTHTLKVAVIDASDFDGEFNYEAFRRHLRRRLHLLDPLRYKLVDIPWRLHHPMWLENCEVDLDYHLRRVRVPAPGGRRELDQVIGEVASTPLDRSRPLWEFHFAEGLAGGRFALIGKVHHALADGVASVNLLARAMDLEDGPTDERDDDGAGVTPTTADLLRAAGRDHVRQIAELPRLLRDATVGFSRVRRRSKERGDHPDLADAFDAPPTFLNHVVSPERRFATAALRLADVKATAKALGITINDLVLATAAGGLRKLLLRYDGQPTVRSSLRYRPPPTSRTELPATRSAVCRFRCRYTSPTRPSGRGWWRWRPRSPRKTTKSWAPLRPLMAYLPMAFAPAVFRWLGHRDAPNKMMNVAVSSVAGPRERGHFGGAPVSEIYSTGVLSPGAPVNITVWSYVDQLGVAVLTDDQTFNDPHEATDALIEAFAELRSTAGLSDQEGQG